MNEQAFIEAQRLITDAEREALRRIRERIASEQLGEAWEGIDG